MRYGPPPPRSAAAQAILAMALFQAGQRAEARAELANAQTIITARFDRELQPRELASYWFDWVVARILMQEAQGVVGQ